MTFIGIDANFFAIFVNAMETGVPETAIAAETKVEALGAIAADTQGQILQEWRDTTGAHVREFVEEWINDALAQDRIRLFSTTGTHQCRKEVSKLGLPSKDAKRLSIHHDIGTKIFISEDIDFFEPTEADCKPARRHKLCHERRGSLCRFIEKQYGIAIYTHQSFLNEDFT